MKKVLFAVTSTLLLTIPCLASSAVKNHQQTLFGVDLLNLSTIADCREPRDKQDTCITRRAGKPNVIFVGSGDMPSGIDVVFGYEPEKNFVIFMLRNCKKDGVLLKYLKDKYGSPSLNKEFEGSYAYDWIRRTEEQPQAVYLTISSDGTCSSAVQIAER